jgi:hypothetical protein
MFGLGFLTGMIFCFITAIICDKLAKRDAEKLFKK